MAAAVQLDSTAHMDWAGDAFMALDEHSYGSSDKWAAYAPPQHSMPPSAFTLPTTLLSDSSIERFGQITPPADDCPSDVRRDSAMREGSIPVEQLQREVSWPGAQDIQALADYQPPSIAEQQPQQHEEDAQKQQKPQQQQQQAEPAPREPAVPDRATKRRRTSKQAAANQSSPDPAPEQPAETNPHPPKRKRGRPKSQPQMVEAFTADGYPFQVSSARQSHLEKNRVAAHKCRQRKKEYINGLEGRAREFSAKNKALKDNVAILREEVLSLKNEVLRHAGCGFWAVDEYLARCAGDLLGIERPPSAAISRHPSQDHSPTLSTMDPSFAQRQSSADSMASPGSLGSQEDLYGGFDLLEDMEDDAGD